MRFYPRLKTQTWPVRACWTHYTDVMNVPEPLVPNCTCPLCGGPNACDMAMAMGQNKGSLCWCTREYFSPQLLQQVPTPLSAKVCVCQACVRASQEVA